MPAVPVLVVDPFELAAPGGQDIQACPRHRHVRHVLVEVDGNQVVLLVLRLHEVVRVLAHLNGQQ